MLAQFFAERRERNSFAALATKQENKIAELETENRRLNALILERDMLFVDRLLTASVRTHPIAAEAEHNLLVKSGEPDPDVKQLETDFLRGKLKELQNDAFEAGLTEKDALEHYNKLQAQYIEQYRDQLGFDN